MKAHCLFLLLAFSLQIPAFAQLKGWGEVEWRESYGGDSTVSELISLASDILLFEGNRDVLKSWGVEADTVVSRLGLTEISCKGDLYLDGVRKEAINYPMFSRPLIELDCARWNTLSDVSKRRLAVHEALSLLFIKDGDYQKSLLLVKQFLSQRMPVLIPAELERFHRAISSCYTDTYQVFIDFYEVDIFKPGLDLRNGVQNALQSDCRPILESMKRNKIFEDPQGQRALVLHALSVISNFAINNYSMVVAEKKFETLYFILSLLSSHPEPNLKSLHLTSDEVEIYDLPAIWRKSDMSLCSREVHFLDYALYWSSNIKEADQIQSENMARVIRILKSEGSTASSQCLRSN